MIEGDNLSTTESMNIIRRYIEEALKNYEGANIKDLGLNLRNLIESPPVCKILRGITGHVITGFSIGNGPYPKTILYHDSQEQGYKELGTIKWQGSRRRTKLRASRSVGMCIVDLTFIPNPAHSQRDIYNITLDFLNELKFKRSI